MKKLTHILQELWITEIKDSYKSGIICSEKHLQAEIYRHFTSNINTTSFQMWVEPTLEFDYEKSKSAKYRPDLVISKEKEVLCFIELKYVPHYYASFQYDIEKLSLYQNTNKGKSFPLKTNYLTGDWADKEENFVITKNVLLVFAVIAHFEAAANDLEGFYEASFPLRNYLILTGKTNGKNPIDFGFSPKV